MKKLLCTLCTMICFFVSCKQEDVVVNNIEDNQPEVQEPEIKYRPFTINGITFNMILVEGGTFKMGSSTQEEVIFQPVHDVTVSDFYISETEVSQELYTAIVRKNPSRDRYPQNPVDCIGYTEALWFIIYLNEITGLDFRLPTEAEWEYAARGGKYSKGYIYAGGDKIDDVAHYGGDWLSLEGYPPKPVKSMLPNELGIYNMSGNVAEWCSDYYGDYPNDAQVNPVGPKDGTYKVIRGGSWSNSANQCAATWRGYSKDLELTTNGIRIVLSVP